MFVGFRPLQRYFEFAGRSGRAEYWQFFGVYMIAIFIAAVIDFGVIDEDGFPVLTALCVVGLATPIYSVTFRRLHDRDKSGWLVGATFVIGAVNGMVQMLSLVTADGMGWSWATIGSVTILGLASLALNVYIFVQLCMAGDPHANRFGPPDDATAAASLPFSRFSRRVHDPLGRIERLGRLRVQGLLTDEEFEIQKAAALRSL